MLREGGKSAAGPADVLAPPAGIVAEEMEDELLLHRPDTGKTVYLNGTAALVWRLLDGERSGAEIAAMLADAYPEAADRIHGDTARTLAEFVERGIAERR